MSITPAPAARPYPSRGTQAEDNLITTRNTVHAALLDLAVPEPDATEWAAYLVKRMQERIGGQDDFYLPVPDKAERDAAIRASYNGANMRAVCEQFGVHQNTVYRAWAKRRG